MFDFVLIDFYIIEILKPAKEMRMLLKIDLKTVIKKEITLEM